MNIASIRTLAIAAAVAVSLGTAGFANAQEHMMGGNMPMLSPEQQSTLQKLNTEFYSATAALRQQIIGKQAELNAQVNSTAPDAAKIETLSKDLGALQGKLLVEHAGLNAKLAKAGLPSAGHGMMSGKDGMMSGKDGMMGGKDGMMGGKGGMMGGMMSGKGGMMGGMGCKGCMEMMKNMGSMQRGAGETGDAAPAATTPPAGQHNQPGHQ